MDADSAIPQAALEAVRDARCVLFAYHEMGSACLEALLELGAPVVALFTHRDAPGEEIWWQSCADLARSHSIPVYLPDKIAADEIAQVAALRPAIIYSFYYRNLLPQGLIDLAPLGAYNLHGSLLPKYRGRAPVNWMIANGEREAGATLHHMVARADAGDIVAQRSVEISDDDTALTLYRKIVPIGATLIRQYHALIALREAPRHAQDLTKGSYFGRRHPEDGRIDWHWPARRIFNLVRAVTHPYPGAFGFLNEHKVYIWTARIRTETGTRGAAGEVIGKVTGDLCGEHSGAIEVAAGEGSVFVSRAQIEGGAETSPREMLESLGLDVATSVVSASGTSIWRDNDAMARTPSARMIRFD
jgi:methionyl-tRNA formyltransferase